MEFTFVSASQSMPSPVKSTPCTFPCASVPSRVAPLRPGSTREEVDRVPVMMGVAGGAKIEQRKKQRKTVR